MNFVVAFAPLFCKAVYPKGRQSAESTTDREQLNQNFDRKFLGTGLIPQFPRLINKPPFLQEERRTLAT